MGDRPGSAPQSRPEADAEPRASDTASVTIDNDGPRPILSPARPSTAAGLGPTCDSTATLEGSASWTNVHLTRQDDQYVPTLRTRRRNDLLLFVGFLEFFNALDFPANVWNQIPTPTFAKGLMVTGGSLAIIASLVAFVDLSLSWRNIKLLRQERAFLEAQRSRTQRGTQPHHYLRAWLSVNFRELFWELVDRLLQDAIVGFGGIVIGVGTIIAIKGEDPHIFKASNLMSGYIGNGLVAVYGVINAGWNTYLTIRARRHSREVMRYISDTSVRKRARSVFRVHQVYAIVNGVNMIVAAAGSLISSTMWFGYVILIPCIIAAIFTNTFWKKKAGYDRLMVPHRPFESVDIYQEITRAIRLQDQLKDPTYNPELSRLPRDAILDLIIKNEMLEDLCLAMVNSPATRRAMLGGEPPQIEINAQTLAAMDFGILIDAVRNCMDTIGFHRARDQERMLYELLGAYLDEERGGRPGEKVESCGKSIDPSSGADEPNAEPLAEGSGAEKIVTEQVCRQGEFHASGENIAEPQISVK